MLELTDSGVKADAVNPGCTATDLNRFRGSQSVEERVVAPVRCALVGLRRSAAAVKR
jgi:short-subunit dehydrogenase